MKNKIKKIIISSILLPFALVSFSNTTHAADPGDAGYREGGYLTVGSDHGGVYYGYLAGSPYVYEIQGYLQEGVELNSFSTFKASKTFYGWMTNPKVTATKRQNMLDTLEAMYNDPGITYTMYAQLKYDSNTSTVVQVSNITDIRCDGVIEYAYERNDLMVWGPTDTGTAYGTPTNYDISLKANVKGHSNLGFDQPYKEVSPRVQRGNAPVTDPFKWTMLRNRTS